MTTDTKKLRELAETATPEFDRSIDAIRRAADFYIVMRDTAADRQWLRDNPTVTAINVNTYTLALDLVEKQAEQIEALEADLVKYRKAAAEQLRYDMAAILTGTPEERAAQQLAAMTAAFRSANTQLRSAGCAEVEVP